ncbi:MAG TPA: DUF2203 domain-containing protein [Terriglobales bacterium]|jgi:hypothetical protein|nr:DUF2203 domain-containing protein [Terriglobales bacterium]
MDSTENFSRLFTVDEANQLLPTLRPLIERVLESIRRLKSTSERVIRTEQIDPDAPNLMDRLKQDDEITRLVEHLKDCVEEINGHGCICKGVEQGLIDFPCLLGDKVVFLCWQIGEVSVNHWHRIEDGFAGRKPLLDSEGVDPGAKTSYH